MNGLAFFDTNILIYADDLDAPVKRAHAIIDLIEKSISGIIRSSFPMPRLLQEYFSITTRKLPHVDPAVAQRKVEILARSRMVRFTEDDVISAIELHRPVTDLVLGCADCAGRKIDPKASVLYSEDLAHGSSIAGVRIHNPFTDGK